MRQLGFLWKKTENNRKILIEKQNIRLKTIEYLEKKLQIQTRRKINYLHRWIICRFTTYVFDGLWWRLNEWLEEKYFESVTSCHHTCQFSLVLFQIRRTKTGDYHSNMNSENYEKWVRMQLIPNLPNNSVVLVDNAFYRNRLDEAAPSFTTIYIHMPT